MARKKSPSGRARGFSTVNNILLQTEKINRQIRRLEESERFGTYKSKELIEFVSRRPALKLKKSKRSKRHRIVVDTTKLTAPEQRLIQKKFKQVLQSQAFSNIGINRIERKIRNKIEQTLSEELGRKISKAELEKFYDILKYKEQVHQESILDKIDPSTFWRLVNTAVSEHQSVTSWVQMLENFVEINNEYMRKEAEELYYKYVKPSL